MDLRNPSIPDPTGQNRRQFLQRTSAASIAAVVGLGPQESTAMTEQGAFESDPFSLGVVVVDPPAVTGNAAPTDPDGDGRYEDLNGDGLVDYDDVRTLIENVHEDSIRENVPAYDFDEDGDLDVYDVIELYLDST